ncbi:anti-sigma-K factor RskA [Pacificibacter maritimus]|uniref:Anti-sigma-K factor RskA n=1 Tax=Pacificibacter maritimus TaxID=762213 RepID=A0A3N4UAY0_9RHOB|nr:anti-sigma factor [Pacificibacter maritimus]RPE66948.1 anti-sigma-K factor RskA [Pacificibacter maritimus]
MTVQRDLLERIDEVVIGLADPSEVAAIELLASEDPKVAALLERARVRFGELDATADPQELPATMWSRVETAIDSNTTLLDDDYIAPMPTKPNAPANTNARPTLWTTLTAVAASIIVGIAIGWTMLPKPDPTVIAVLLGDNGLPVALVEGAKDNTTRVTMLDAANVPQGKVMQVWTKPDADGLPVSLGVLDAPVQAALKIDGLPEPEVQQLYEITFEQQGGSPTGLPTGPIYGKGLAQQPL